MIDYSQYRVGPRPPVVDPTPEDQMQQFPGIGVFQRRLIYILSYVVTFAIVGSLLMPVFDAQRNGFLKFLIDLAILGIPILPGYLWVRSLDKSKREEQDLEFFNKRVREQADKNDRESEELASSLVALINSSLELAEQLPILLGNASRSLQIANSEFHERAFDPFWIALENGLCALGTFHDHCQLISRNADSYYSRLAGRDHNFPPFPVASTMIPNPTTALLEFRQLLRKGQTDFQFAQIWGHRKTRQVLISGFQTLADAVIGLTDSLLGVFSSTTQSLEGLHNLMLEQRAILDNLNERH